MVSEATRRSMQGNRRSDTKPELTLRKHLREAGLTGYRLQWKVPCTAKMTLASNIPILYSHSTVAMGFGESS